MEMSLITMTFSYSRLFISHHNFCNIHLMKRLFPSQWSADKCFHISIKISLHMSLLFCKLRHQATNSSVLPKVFRLIFRDVAFFVTHFEVKSNVNKTLYIKVYSTRSQCCRGQILLQSASRVFSIF